MASHRFWRTALKVACVLAPSIACADELACGILPQADEQPSPGAVHGRWESCKVDPEPGCAFGAYSVTFWRRSCLRDALPDFDIHIAFEWIEGAPLLPGQPDANGAYRGLPYKAAMQGFTLGQSRTVVRLADGRTTHDLSEAETAAPFRLVGIVDRAWMQNGEQQTMPGDARYTFCPSSTTLDYCSGVSGGFNAQPIVLAETVFSSGFDDATL